MKVPQWRHAEIILRIGPLYIYEITVDRLRVINAHRC